jgi:hypothetical protein
MRTLICLTICCCSLIAFAACGGSEDDGTASIIHRLLLAASADNAGELESFSGRLPEGLPVEPPLYPGAEVVVSSQRPAATAPEETPEPSGNIPQPMVYFIVLDTADARNQVLGFYIEELNQDPWQINNTYSTADLDTVEFSNVDDADISGVVSIATGGQDGRVGVLISLQDAGSFREELPPFEPEESLRLPVGFPEDIPIYEEAVVTGTAFFREPGNESFLVIFISTDSQDAIIDFYRNELQARGWNVQLGEALGLEERMDFRDQAGTLQGDILLAPFERDDSYIEARMQIREDPAREPVEPGDVTPQPTSAQTAEPTAP